MEVRIVLMPTILYRIPRKPGANNNQSIAPAFRLGWLGKGGARMLLGLSIWLQNRMSKLRDEDGATAVEYGLMAALIAAAIIVFVQALGTNVAAVFDSIAEAIGEVL